MTVEENNGPAAPYQGPSTSSRTQGHGSKNEQDAVEFEVKRGADSPQPSDKSETDQNDLNDGTQSGEKTD